MKTLAHVVLIVFLIYPYAVFGQKKAKYEEIRISGSFENVSLSHILENVKNKDGYKVVVPDAWAGRKVSGDFDQVNLSNFIKHVVKGRNFSILIDEPNLIIVFQDFGAIAPSEYVETPDVEKGGLLIEASADIVNSNTQNQSGENIYETSLPSTFELKEIHRAQLEAYNRAKKDPNTIDPETGLTIGYLQSLHEKQMALDKELSESPDYIDPFSQINIEQKTSTIN